MRTNLIFFLSNASVGMSILFIPIIASQFGASDIMTGAIVSFYGVMSLASFYIFGWVSDRRGRVFLIRWGMAFSTVTFFLQVLVNDPVSLLVVRGLCGLSVGIFYSSLVIYGIESGKKLGKFTSYESLGWGVGNLIAGIVGVYVVIFGLSSVFFLISLVLSLSLPKMDFPRVKVPLFPHKLIKKNLGIYLPFFLRDIGAFSIFAFLPIYFAQLGASYLWIGILYFLNMGTQFFFKQFVDRYDHRWLFRVGLILSASSFFAYAFAQNIAHLIPIQLLLSLAWSSISVGAMGSLTDDNLEKATVVGLFSSARSFAMIIGPFIAGFISEYFGFRPLMCFSGSITVLGLMVSLINSKRV